MGLSRLSLHSEAHSVQVRVNLIQTYLTRSKASVAKITSSTPA